jgi:hypothetical protein
MAPASGAAHVEMDTASMILFDRATGQRIPPASAGATGEQAA